MGKANKKIYGKVVGKDASDRPGWKGPSYVKKKAAPPPPPKSPSPSAENEEPTIPIELQQLLLNIFRDTFKEVLESNDRQKLLQEVKNALYERDFTRAFGKKEFLETYSVRWSPSRALCYQSVFVDVGEHLRGIWPVCGVLSDEEGEGKGKGGKEGKRESESLRVVAFGGGAAEVVAFGGFLRRVLDCCSEDEDVTGLEEGIESLSVENPDPVESGSSTQVRAEVDPTTTSVEQSSEPTASTENEVQAEPETKSVEQNSESTSSPQDGTEAETATTSQNLSSESPMLDLILIDSAQWGPVISNLTSSLTSPPPISKYANAAAKAANTFLLHPTHLSTTFYALDILSMTASQMSTLLGPTPNLLTLLFTLNELYTHSISLTTKFLLNLTMTSTPGTMLLVIDSPGSYSQTSVKSVKKVETEEEEGEGGEAKKYPMHWLLDHTLLDTVKLDGEAVWEKLVEDGSKWWRVAEELRYPISLENMRFQIHLYRRL